MDLTRHSFYFEEEMDSGKVKILMEGRKCRLDMVYKGIYLGGQACVAHYGMRC